MKFRITAFIFSLALLTAGCGQSDNEPAAEAQQSAQATISQAAPEQKLNVNTASSEELMTVPGAGERMVGEFEEYRFYTSIRQFRQEIGKYVDEEQVAAYEQYLFVPIDPNESDAASLQQIPGLEAEEAEQLIEARPFESDSAFLEELGQYVSEEQQADAEQYLVTE